MTLGDLLQKVDIKAAAADLSVSVGGVSSNTRTLKRGEIFVAISGYECDGHSFIGEAAEKGAVCVICEKKPDADIPYIVVDDSREAHAIVCAEWFGNPANELITVGVTGTNGKTSVATILKALIEKCSGKKVGLIGTNVNMIGCKELCSELTTPDSYEMQKLLRQMKDEGCTYAVMEVSSHALQQKRVYGIEFETGVFTNISPEHMDYHTSIEEYAEVKSSLFLQCRAAAINIDDDFAQLMTDRAKCRLITFGIKNGDADLVAKNIKLYPDCVEFGLLKTGSLSRVKLKIPGLFSVYNALAVVSAATLLGFDDGQLADALESAKGVKGRAEIVPTDADYTVLIDYAHTPDALRNIIKTARGFADGRVITVFGCGGDRDKKKRPAMGKIAAELSDVVIVTSDNPRTENPEDIIGDILTGMTETKTKTKTKTETMVILNRREAIFQALEAGRPGDVIILAGKGHETYQIFGKEKTHFDEREVVMEFFADGQ